MDEKPDRLIPLDHIEEPSRIMAPFRWGGGKGHFAKRIVPLLPKKAKVYVEPYLGAGSVFWHLPRPYPVEVLNDLHQEIVNVFRCLQQEELFQELARRIIWTPYSREEFARALEICSDDPKKYTPVERAWAFLVKHNQTLAPGREDLSAGTWGRAFVSTRRMAMSTNKW